MTTDLTTLAVVLDAPERLALRQLDLVAPGPDELVVEVEWSGISTGTERLLWSGRMPTFPGMGYPLVPGYESVGRVVDAGPAAAGRLGERVFVPGAQCYGAVRGLFGGAASRIVLPAARAVAVDDALGERAVLLALAATAHHALAPDGIERRPFGPAPELIVGHGVLGRLLARLACCLFETPPLVWESNPERTGGALGYQVVDPAADARRDYASIYDVSGDGSLLDGLIGRLARGGEVVLAGFYQAPLQFAFPPAFMREARLRVAAEWQRADLEAVTRLLADGRLSLDGLITHRERAASAERAYRTAFDDPACLKMVLDWRSAS